MQQLPQKADLVERDGMYVRATSLECYTKGGSRPPHNIMYTACRSLVINMKPVGINGLLAALHTEPGAQAKEPPL